jgi:hypothetical protein
MVIKLITYVDIYKCYKIRPYLTTSKSGLKILNIHQHLTVENIFYRFGHFWTMYLDLQLMASR